MPVFFDPLVWLAQRFFSAKVWLCPGGALVLYYLIYLFILKGAASLPKTSSRDLPAKTAFCVQPPRLDFRCGDPPTPDSLASLKRNVCLFFCRVWQAYSWSTLPNICVLSFLPDSTVLGLFFPQFRPRSEGVSLSFLAEHTLILTTGFPRSE